MHSVGDGGDPLHAAPGTAMDDFALPLPSNATKYMLSGTLEDGLTRQCLSGVSTPPVLGQHYLSLNFPELLMYLNELLLLQLSCRRQALWVPGPRMPDQKPSATQAHSTFLCHACCAPSSQPRLLQIISWQDLIRELRYGMQD